MMDNVIQVTPDLVLEVWPAGYFGNRAFLKLRSLSLEKDAMVCPGSVVIFEDEIHPLIAALVENGGGHEERGN